MFDIIITRHDALVEYLKEQGLANGETKVVPHATSFDVAGKNVCGVLPHSLSCLCKSFTEVPLDIPAELRGKELALEQVREFAGPAKTYHVLRLVGATREDRITSGNKAVAARHASFTGVFEYNNGWSTSRCFKGEFASLEDANSASEYDIYSDANPYGDCDVFVWAVPTGIAQQIKQWRESAVAFIKESDVQLYVTWDLRREGYKLECIVESFYTFQKTKGKSPLSGCKLSKEFTVSEWM